MIKNGPMIIPQAPLVEVVAHKVPVSCYTGTGFFDIIPKNPCKAVLPDQETCPDLPIGAKHDQVKHGIMGPMHGFFYYLW